MTERRKTSKREPEGAKYTEDNHHKQDKKEKKKRRRSGDVEVDLARRFEWETEDWVAL